MTAPVLEWAHKTSGGTRHNFRLPKNDFTYTAAPGVNDDDVAGFSRGSRIYASTPTLFYRCKTPTAGAAVWEAEGTSGASAISSLNGLTAGTQTFAKVDDTNVTLTISSVTSTHTLTVGWTGTLAGSRITNGAITEVKQTLADVTTLDVSSTMHGYAPKSPADATKFLNGAAAPAYALVKDSDLSTSDITTNNASTTKHGFAPKYPNDATKFLDGTGAYSSPTTVSGNAGTVTVADAGGDTTTWVLLGTSQTGNLAPATDASLTYNATSNALTATTFIGALTGNASTATTLATPRNIGGVSFNGSADIVPQTIESANEASDTTCFPLFITASGTQQLQPKNNTSFTFNASTAVVGAKGLNISSGTLTSAADIASIASTWNNVSSTFNGLFINIGNTASAAGSRLVNVQQGSVERLSVASDGLLYVTQADGNSSSASIVAKFGHNAAGTVGATGIGGAIDFNLETSTTPDTFAGRLLWEAIDGTHATFKSRLTFNATDNGASPREFARGWGDGSNSRFAFAVPAAAPTDAQIASGQTSFYLDETNNYLIARCKESGATFFSVTLNKPPSVQVITSGSGTYTTPAGALFLIRRMLGGGGGGAGSGTSPGAATAGGTSSFGSVNCTGGGAGRTDTGVPAVGAPSAGDWYTQGGAGAPGGTTNAIGGFGGSSALGGGGVHGLAGAGPGGSGQANGAGGGGAGSGATANAGGGGSAGGFSEQILLSPSASYSYAVGAGGNAGTAGTAGAAGGAGAAGLIEVIAFF